MEDVKVLAPDLLLTNYMVLDKSLYNLGFKSSFIK